MSTQVPAPLYVHSHSSGFHPVNAEPGEPASKKPSAGGLMSKLDRLVQGFAFSSTSTDSTVASNPKNASTAVGASQLGETPGRVSFRILTWNIWFENLLQRQRTSALIATVKSLDPLPDVCCFQECTSAFERQLEGDDWWRKTWVMTKCADQFAVTGFHYGTMMFVRRELVERMEFKARAWFEPFETSQNGRGLLIMELTSPKSKHPVR